MPKVRGDIAVWSDGLVDDLGRRGGFCFFVASWCLSSSTELRVNFSSGVMLSRNSALESRASESRSMRLIAATASFLVTMAPHFCRKRLRALLSMNFKLQSSILANRDAGQ